MPPLFRTITGDDCARYIAIGRERRATKWQRIKIMSELTLRIPEGGEVVIPPEFFECNLSCEELGAIIYWMALGELKIQGDHPVLASEETKRVVKKLVDEKILYVESSDGSLVLGVDLSSRQPPSETEDAT